MSTRSLTRIYRGEETAEFLCIYRHSDGYPAGMGLDLAEFLDGLQVVNGISLRERGRVANGAGCLAAQLVDELKTEPGNVYIEAPGTKDMSEEYEYHVVVREAGHPVPVTLRCYSVDGEEQKRVLKPLCEGVPADCREAIQKLEEKGRRR
jgi:hypothetical protein